MHIYIIITMLSVVVTAQGRQQVGVCLQVGDLENVVLADVTWTMSHVLYWLHLDILLI